MNIICTKCKTTFGVPPRLQAGQQVLCVHCKAVNIVPVAQAINALPMAQDYNPLQQSANGYSPAMLASASSPHSVQSNDIAFHANAKITVEDMHEQPYDDWQDLGRLRDWTNERVCEWLTVAKKGSLVDYIPAFQREKIMGEDLSDLSRDVTTMMQTLEMEKVHRAQK